MLRPATCKPPRVCLSSVAFSALAIARRSKCSRSAPRFSCSVQCRRRLTVTPPSAAAGPQGGPRAHTSPRPSCRLLAAGERGRRPTPTWNGEREPICALHVDRSDVPAPALLHSDTGRIPDPQRPETQTGRTDRGRTGHREPLTCTRLRFTDSHINFTYRRVPYLLVGAERVFP